MITPRISLEFTCCISVSEKRRRFAYRNVVISTQSMRQETFHTHSKITISQLLPPTSRVSDRFYPTQCPLPPPLPIPAIPANISCLRPILPYSVPSLAPTAYPGYPRQYLESETDFTLLSSLSGPHCLFQLSPPIFSSLRPILPYSVPFPAPTAYPSYPRQHLESQTDIILVSSLAGPHCLSLLPPPISRVSDRFYPIQFPLRPPLPIPAIPANISSLRTILPYSVPSPAPTAYPSYPRQYLESQTVFTLLSSLSSPHCLPQLSPQRSRVSD